MLAGRNASSRSSSFGPQASRRVPRASIPPATQLEGSLATAKVIAGGAREVWAMFRLVRSFVPTK